VTSFVAPGTTARAVRPTSALTSPGLRELVVLALVYVGYAASRVLADDSLSPAVTRARRILDLERMLHLDVEGSLNRWFLQHDVLGVAGAFYYASAHYVLTMLVVAWLFRRHRAAYAPARLALVGSTAVALVAYLAMPTAPPRLVGAYADLLAVHSTAGWWGGEASAPQGLGGLTNQLAAFPSMHAGWALWVALAVAHASSRRWLTALAWGHAVVTGIVIVGTGNHWLLDVVAGWAVVLIAWRTVGPDREAALRPDHEAPIAPDRGTAGGHGREAEVGPSHETTTGPVPAVSLSRPPAAPAPCAPAPGRWSSTSVAERP
jgi:hypothetical protein